MIRLSEGGLLGTTTTYILDSLGLWQEGSLEPNPRAFYKTWVLSCRNF